MSSPYPLRRSRHNVQIAGVCSGIADYFDWDTTMVRVVYVFATIFTAFSGVLVYLLLWLLIPQREYD